MKKVMIAALMVMSTVAVAKETVTATGGELTVNDTNVEFRNTKGQVVKVPVSEGLMSVSVKGKYKNSAQDSTTVLLELATGGNGCPATYTIYEIMPDGTGRKTSEFGTCSDIPEISHSPKGLVVNMPLMDTNKIVTYTYENGVLTKSVKLPTKLSKAK